jgi:hypothetical protein
MKNPVRFRMWVRGELVDDTTIELWGPGDHLKALANSHAMSSQIAEARGWPYLIEVEFWDGEHVRWGTDTDGMVTPVRVGLGYLLDAILARYENG